MENNESKADPNKVSVLNCISAEDGSVERINQPHCKDDWERKERCEISVVLFWKVVQEHTAWRSVDICSEDQEEDDENVRVCVVRQAFCLQLKVS